MKFLELINKCLLELNYKTVNSLSELVKNDHKRILNILNIINKEVCQSGKWDFLLRRAKFILPPNTTEIDNNVNGRILYLFIDGKRYRFSENIEKFMEGSQNGGYYSSFHDKLLFPKFDKEKVIDVIYYSNNCVQEENGNEKTDFEDIKDCSLIPMPFVEQILVYGTCLRLKGNPQHFKFSYWMSMYKEALANLKSKTSVSVDNAPKVRLFRD